MLLLQAFLAISLVIVGYFTYEQYTAYKKNPSEENKVPKSYWILLVGITFFLVMTFLVSGDSSSTDTAMTLTTLQDLGEA